MGISFITSPLAQFLLPACLAKLPFEAFLLAGLLISGSLIYFMPWLFRRPSKRTGRKIFVHTDQDNVDNTEKRSVASSPLSKHFAGSWRGSSPPVWTHEVPAVAAVWTPPVRPPPRPAVRQASRQPVQPPSLDAEVFTEQVDELVALIAPTAECERVVQELAQTVKFLIRKNWPTASVMAIVNGEISRCTSFGVAVPEVDVIVKLRPQELAWPLQARLSRSGSASGSTDMRKLQKSAIRVCTDVLVSEGGFKFRRSAFRGKEPKVTLMAPRALGVAEQNIPIDFSVNADIPLCNLGLLAELARLDPRAKALALLVRRWAKDRGICHAAKGHLPPFAWTLLTIYFLQVGVETGPLLPALKHLKVPKSPDATIWGSRDHMPSAMQEIGNETVAQLFTQFVRFYSETIDLKAEAVSVCDGKRSPAPASMPPHSMRMPDGVLQTAPAIENPFTPNHNVAESLTADGLDRMSEELRRASVMIENGSSLTSLLSPWEPPDHRANAKAGSDDDEGEEEERAIGLASLPKPKLAVPAMNGARCESGDGGEVLKSPPGLNEAEEQSVHPWNRCK